MGEERKFDIEEYVMKATAFHEDKERAEKLSKKKGYLNSLCQKLEEKVFFKAVYEELFPKDKNTIELLENLINTAFNEEKDSWLFLNIETIEELDFFKKEVKKRVKATLKALQRHQIAQNNLVQRRAREEAERQEAERLQKLQQSTKKQNEVASSTPQITRPFARQPEQVSQKEDVVPLVYADRDKFIIDLNKNPIRRLRELGDIGGIGPRRFGRSGGVVRESEPISPEILAELHRDRIHARERARNLPEMMKEVDRRHLQEFREAARRLQPQKEPPKQLGR